MAQAAKPQTTPKSAAHPASAKPAPVQPAPRPVFTDFASI